MCTTVRTCINYIHMCYVHAYKCTQRKFKISLIIKLTNHEVSYKCKDDNRKNLLRYNITDKFCKEISGHSIESTKCFMPTINTYHILKNRPKCLLLKYMVLILILFIFLSARNVETYISCFRHNLF